MGEGEGFGEGEGEGEGYILFSLLVEGFIFDTKVMRLSPFSTLP